MESRELFVGGRRVAGRASREVVDPWTRETFDRVPLADQVLAEEAVVACVKAFEATKRMPTYARRDVCAKVASLLRGRKEELAVVLAREAGKPILLARLEVERAASTFAIAAEVATRPTGAVIPLDLSEAQAKHSGSYTRVPKGPVLAFSPFNFPLNLVAHKVAPALACGASVLVKPAPKTPLSALALADIVREAGAPEDAVTVLPCDDDVAEKLVRDDRFALFTFTGSARVGYLLKAIAGKKHVILELGGNASALVHDDAPDLGWAMDTLTTSAFAYAGQVCIKTQRIFVHHARYEEVAAGLAERASRLRPEEPVSAEGVLGPVLDAANGKRIGEWIDEATSRGAKALVAGARDENRLGATVLEVRGATKGMRAVDEEIFGPVLVVRPYTSIDEAIAEVNASRYGLQAAIFSDSQRAIDAAYDGLDVGGLVVNDSPSFRNDAMPYGGVKDSGLGREGVSFAVEEYTAPKMRVVRRV